jgi:DNA uptake protein ComE-like DNA-binding protein
VWESIATRCIMKRWLKKASCVLLCTAVTVIAPTACSRNSGAPDDRRSDDQKKRERGEKTRQTIADATQRAKPTLEKAGKKLEEAAKVVAEETRAAAQGVKEGWNRDQHNTLDLNSAREGELLGLPGITRHDAQRIIDERPYHRKHELVTKGILSEARYEEIRDRILVK